MSSVNIYLNFMGNTLEVFEFYRSIFGWEFTALEKFSDIPNLEGREKMTPKEKEGVMHVALPIFSNMVLMGTDMVESFWHQLIMGNNFSISLNVDSKKDALKYFQALSEGGTIEMPLDDMFWWAFFGSCKDKYGISWMVNYEYPKK